MQLYVWGPALDAPSISPQCIVVEAYLRMLNIDYTLVLCNDPQTSPTGELPLIKDGSTWIAGMDRILNHLTKRGHDGNDDLSPEDKADCFAYSTLIKDHLFDCMLYTWYADTTNYVKCIRPTYAQLLSFPSTYYVPMQLRKQAKARLARRGVEITSDDAGQPQNEEDEKRELLRSGWNYMYTLARGTYRTLDDKLGDNPFVFGNRPTTLDCIMFGYLSLHLYPILPHGRLQYILKNEYPKLVSFCDHFRQTYFTESATIMPPAPNVPTFWQTMLSHPREFFSHVKENSGIGRSSSSSTNPRENKSSANVEFERKRIWSIVGGVTFLLAYVLYNGIVQIEVGDDEQEDDE